MGSIRESYVRAVCATLGHIPVWINDPTPSADYRCARCGRRIYFWRGRRTGWHLEPEPAWSLAWLEQFPHRRSKRGPR